jgi:esterase/lipase
MKKIFYLICILLLTACSSEPSWYQPTGSAAGVPENADLSFEEYVENSRKNIEKVLSEHRFINGESPYVGDYSIAEVVEMRSPFQLPVSSVQLCTNKEQGAGKGFLLIHGLTDSPYLLKGLANSIAEQNPCALIRAVLLPGHGTVVGDTLNMKYQDWQAITQYGVNSFNAQQQIDSVYLVGFSTGTALAIKETAQLAKDTKVKGLILLSTALKASSDLAWLTTYIKGVKPWLDQKIERDAARYSSFSANAGSQFYQLTKNLSDEKYQTQLPVLMVLSSDDATVNAQASRDYFCNRVSNKRKLMLWYKGYAQPSASHCAGVIEIERQPLTQSYKGEVYQYANLAHTGVPVSPDDSHYGVKGVYRDCKAYEQEGDDSLWSQCMQDNSSTIFAEKNIVDKDQVLKDEMWRRGTFNKDYQQLVKAIACFTQQECQLESIQH